MSTGTRVDQPASSNDVNVLGDVVYGKILKCNGLANSPSERNSRYERLTRAERRERQKQWRAIGQERTKSRPQEIRTKRNNLIAQVSREVLWNATGFGLPAASKNPSKSIDL